jgi:hypothetical protein
MEVSNEEARLLEQLRSNPQVEEHLHALLECAQAEHLGQAGADEVEERVVKHIKDIGLAAMHGWARQTEEQCARQVLRDEPGARLRKKKEKK